MRQVVPAVNRLVMHVLAVLAHQLPAPVGHHAQIATLGELQFAPAGAALARQQRPQRPSRTVGRIGLAVAGIVQQGRMQIQQLAAGLHAAHGRGRGVHDQGNTNRLFVKIGGRRRIGLAVQTVLADQ